MRERESDIERKVCDYAKRHGFLTWKFVSPGRHGVPDRIFIRRGEITFVEFKKMGGKLTGHQDRRIRELRREGCRVYVIYTVDEGKELVDTLMEDD